MSPHKGYMNIAIAAMLFVAAFAGVAFIADEDVVAEDGVVSSITYKIENGDSAYRVIKGESTFIAPSPEDLGLDCNGMIFIEWRQGNTVFKAGQEYLISALVADKIAGSDSKNATLVAKFDENVYFKTEGGDVVKTIVYANDTFGTIGETEYNVLCAESMKKAGFVFDGWLYNGKLYEVTKEKAEASAENVQTDGSTEGQPQPAYIYKVKLIGSTPEKTLDLEKGMIFVAQYTPIFDVTFVVDGTTVAKCASNEFAQGGKTLQPIDPVKANYTFMGWAVDGKIVSEVKAGVITIPADYKFEADTAFTAVFEPVQLTLTLVVGEFQTTQPALYGQKITAPGLPDGYSHWATMAIVDEKEVYTEFDFSQEIVESMTLYAQKAEKIYTISFVSEGAVIGGPYDVSKPYTIPADPVVEGKKFVGWFVGDFKVADIKAYVAEHPDEDIVLTASFTQADAPAGPGFFETNEGKCVAVIIGVALLAFVYAVYTNMFGMKDLLTSIKIQRVKKE